MKKKNQQTKTTVGKISKDVLLFTAAEDVVLDQSLVQVDCIATAAHVTMLSELRVTPPLISSQERVKVIRALLEIMKDSAASRFRISLADQDVHLAVERTLTKRLGGLGKKIHTARSRNDQVAVDLRLYTKEQLLELVSEGVALAKVLVRCSKRYEEVPMVGRTHMQPAMPSSVGLWASAHAESLLDDLALTLHAYRQNDRCPLGSAAGYGVPLEVNRERVSDLLGFERACHNVLYANNCRGKLESVVLSALSQIMLTLSRLAQDLILFGMPEFNYFEVPAGFLHGK